MSPLIKQGKITPVKKLGKVSLFLRADVKEKYKELEPFGVVPAI